MHCLSSNGKQPFRPDGRVAQKSQRDSLTIRNKGGHSRWASLVVDWGTFLESVRLAHRLPAIQRATGTVKEDDKGVSPLSARDFGNALERFAPRWHFDRTWIRHGINSVPSSLSLQNHEGAS